MIAPGAARGGRSEPHDRGAADPADLRQLRTLARYDRRHDADALVDTCRRRRFSISSGPMEPSRLTAIQ